MIKIKNFRIISDYIIGYAPGFPSSGNRYPIIIYLNYETYKEMHTIYFDTEDEMNICINKLDEKFEPTEI